MTYSSVHRSFGPCISDYQYVVCIRSEDTRWKIHIHLYKSESLVKDFGETGIILIARLHRWEASLRFYLVSCRFGLEDGPDIVLFSWTNWFLGGVHHKCSCTSFHTV